jgi:hypothetical protein
VCHALVLLSRRVRVRSGCCRVRHRRLLRSLSPLTGSHHRSPIQRSKNAISPPPPLATSHPPWALCECYRPPPRYLPFLGEQQGGGGVITARAPGPGMWPSGARWFGRRLRSPKKRVCGGCCGTGFCVHGHGRKQRERSDRSQGLRRGPLRAQAPGRVVRGRGLRSEPQIFFTSPPVNMDLLHI